MKDVDEIIDGRAVAASAIAGTARSLRAAAADSRDPGHLYARAAALYALAERTGVPR